MEMRFSYTGSRRRVWTLQLVFVVSVLWAQGQPQVPDPSRIIQINLELYGWQRLQGPARHESWPTEAQLMRVDSRGRVLIGYTAHEDTGLATRGNPRLSFHILRFTPEGKQDLSLSLPTDNLPDNAVFLDANDHIFVVANEMLQMLAGDDQTPSQQRTWKPLTSCSRASEYCKITQSPTRSRLFAIRCLGPVQRKLCENPTATAYDTSSSEAKVIKDCVSGRGTATDRFRYLPGWDGVYFIRRYPLCHSDASQELPLGGLLGAILNDDLFVVHRLNKRKRWRWV